MVPIRVPPPDASIPPIRTIIPGETKFLTSWVEETIAYEASRATVTFTSAIGYGVNGPVVTDTSPMFGKSWIVRDVTMCQKKSHVPTFVREESVRNIAVAGKSRE